MPLGHPQLDVYEDVNDDPRQRVGRRSQLIEISSPGSISLVAMARMLKSFFMSWGYALYLLV